MQLKPWTDDEIKKPLQLLKEHIGPLNMDILSEALQRSKFDIGVAIFTLRDSAETAASNYRRRVPWYLRRPFLNQPSKGLYVTIPGDKRDEAAIHYPDGRVEYRLMRKGDTFSH
ncbi:hypothetical protein LY76DRAFT_651606 [Colletotrichum caudatum]|nr:hypothetical protein LY76DRAFT_651606 [Colletotrichum caudatum]